MSRPKASLRELNEGDAGTFVAVCGPFFERSQWIAERTWSRRPFASLADLHGALMETVGAATKEERLELIRSHPDLVGRLAEGLTKESASEQRAAGLDELREGEAALLARYNALYRSKFDFPFVICARENRKDAILAAFPSRLANEREEEIRTSLSEIAKIARLRLLDAVMEDQAMVRLTDNSYGKCDVRVTKVVRDGSTHNLFELAVQIMLGGEFEALYTSGDNSLCVPTDTMKNTVYALAKKHSFGSPEEFGSILAAHFVESFKQVSWAEVGIRQTLWGRISVKGKPHEHAFTKDGSASRYANVRHERGAPPRVQGGLVGLEVLKSSGSQFAGFLRDEYTTLRETSERIFATSVDATWTYENSGAAYNASYEAARRIILEVFAEHYSKSVQQTIYAIGESLLAAIQPINTVSISMPNQHRLLANLEPFGLSNENEIFVATSEPFGLITGTVSRS